MALRIGLEQIGAEIVLLGAKDFAGVVRSTEKDIDRLNNKVKQLETQSSSAFTNLNKAVTASLGATAVSIGIFTAAVGAIGGVALTAAADYEQATKNIQAITFSTDRVISQLTSTITELASTTRVGMTEAASAAAELARGGIEVQDQIDGALKSVIELSIASAGELGLERSAVLVASSLKAFNLAGGESVRVANAIATAAQNSAITFVDLQRSFQQAAPSASLLGLTVEDLAGALGVMGEQGLRGSDAGTALKQAFQQLIKPTKQTQEIMAQYGISLFDADGKTRPFRDTLVDLEREFGDSAVAAGKLTEADRALALATLGGSDAVRALIVFAKRGVGAFDEFTTAITDGTRSAAEMAKIMQQTLNAQIQIFVNNLGILAVKIGTGLLDPLKAVVANAILAARSLQPLAELIGATLGALAADEGLGQVIEKINELAGADVSTVFTSIITFLSTIRDAVTQDIVPAFERLFGAISDIGGNTTFLENISTAFINASGAVRVLSAGIATVTDLFSRVLEEANKSERGIQLVTAALAALVIIPLATVAAGFVLIAINVLSVVGPVLLVGAAIGSLVAVMLNLPSIWSSVVDQIATTTEAADIVIEPDREAQLEALQKTIEDYENSIESIVDLQNATSIDLSPDLAVLKEGLEDAQSLYNTAIGNVSEAVEESDVSITPDLEEVAEALTDEIDQHVAAAEAIVNIAGVAAASTRSTIEKASPFDAFSENLRLAIIDIQEGFKIFILNLSTVLTAFAKFANEWDRQWGFLAQIAGIRTREIIIQVQSVAAAFATIAQSSEFAQFTLPNPGESLRNIEGEITQGIEDFKNRIGSIRTEFDTGLNRILEESASRIKAVGGAATTAAGPIAGLGDDAAKTGKKIKEEALPAINGFLDAITQAARLQEFVDAFGDTGAKAIDALVVAVVNNIDKEGAKAAEALADFKQELRKSGVEDFAELGFELDEAFAAALIARSDVAIDAAKEVLGRAVNAIKAQGALTLQTFGAAFNLANVSAQLGSDGEKLVDGLREAIANGTTKLVREVGTAANSLVRGFINDLPIEAARDFGARIVAALKDVIRERTPQAINALQNLITKLNFDAAIIKLGEARATAINVATDAAFEAITIAQERARKETEDFISETSIKSIIDFQVKAINDAADAQAKALQNSFDNVKRIRDRGREDAERALDREREDAEKAEDRLQQLADARKKAQQKLASQGTPVGGVATIAGSNNASSEIDELKKKWAREDARDAQVRKQQDADLVLRRKQQDADFITQRDNSLKLGAIKTSAEKDVLELRDKEETRQYFQRLNDITTKGQATEDDANLRLANITKVEDQKFDHELERLLEQKTLTDSIFDDFLADQDIAILKFEDMRKAAKRLSLNIEITTSGDTETDSEGEFARGGFVPGHGPRVIKAHGGEYIMTVEQVAAFERMFRPASTGSSMAITNNYNVSPSYNQIESPADISLDLQALIALSGR